jgi:hypothetical protein
MFCQQPIMLIDWLLVNLTYRLTQGLVTSYNNKIVICYPIIIRIIIKITLHHRLPIGNNWLLYT